MYARKISALMVGVIIFLASTTATFAAWTSVGDGIDYQEFTAAGPNRLFVSRMDRNNPNVTIDTSVAYDSISGAVQVLTGQVARQDGAITWWGGSWGNRNKVVAAVNGGYWDIGGTNIIEGGQVQTGWYSHWYADNGAFSGFVWKTDRTAFHGQCVKHTAAKVKVVFANGNSLPIYGVNTAQGSNKLYIFTPQYDNQTPAGSHTEVVVEMTKPTLLTSGSNYTVGYVRQVMQNAGATWIPFDHIVLSADGDAGTQLKNYSVVGEQVKIYQELLEKTKPDVQGNNACQTLTNPADFSNAFASINTNYHFLENGVVRVPDAVTHPGYIGYVNLNPRTAICWNSQYIYFVICDGRNPGVSVGMSCETLGNWAKDVLGATDGVNNDGGGSSEIVVNGAIMNNPSDGQERGLCNAIMMVNVEPKIQVTTYGVGQTVTVSSTANLRLGPGSNYGIRGTASANQTGVIQSHSLNGVYAKGDYWWKVNIGGTVAWIAQSLLKVSGNGEPVITQQPQSQTVAVGGTATFVVGAAGSGTLNYQWKKNNVSLTNTGHYSDVFTSIFKVSECDASDVASYTCTVTNTIGNATSNAAALTLGTSPAAPNALPASGIGSDTITWNWSTVSGATGYRLWTAPTGGTQIGGTITGTNYNETGLQSGTMYTRYVEAINACCVSATRTQLGPADTLARNCVENPSFENGFQITGVANHWANIYVGTDGSALFADTTAKYNTGAHAQSINISGSSAKDSCGYVYQKVNVVPGRTYTINGFFLLSNNSSLHSRFGYDTAGGNSPTAAGVHIQDFPANTSAPWSTRPINVTATGSVLTIFAGGFFSPRTGSGYAYVDDISIEPAPPTSSTGATTIGIGMTATLSASGGYGGDNDQLYWYYGPNGTGGLAGIGAILSVSPSVNTTYYPRWEAISDCGSGGCCISDDGPAVTIAVDPIPPTAVSVFDEGTYTPSLTTLKANWTTATDVGTGVNRYEYAIGTSSTTQDVKGWTSVGLNTTMTDSSLTLTEGTTKYYIQARAVDNAGNAGAGSSANGISVPPGVSTIAQAMEKPNGFVLALRNKVVTASGGREFTIEEPDRSMAINVGPSSIVPPRDHVVSVAGTMGGNVRHISASMVIDHGPTTPIQPLGMSQKWLAGGNYNAFTPALPGCSSLYNVGMLVRTWGKVTYSDSTYPSYSYFVIDDGSGYVYLGHPGIIVYCGSVIPPTSGYVAVTGIVGLLYMTPYGDVPTIAVRDAADIVSY